MKEKSFFSRLFGGGAEAQENPRLNAAREQIIKDAEAELAATRPIDTIADAFAKADARRRKSAITNLRGKEELAKQVENTFKMCAGAGLSSVLHKHGLVIFNMLKYADILWPLFKEELLKGDAWLIRADQKDSSRLTEEERRFFGEGGAEKTTSDIDPIDSSQNSPKHTAEDMIADAIMCLEGYADMMENCASWRPALSPAKYQEKLRDYANNVRFVIGSLKYAKTLARVAEKGGTK